MYKIYFLVLLVAISSCSTKIRYIGKSLPPTKNIDVFIAEQSIKKDFDLIGQGYLGGFGPHTNQNKIQQKSELLGRKKGADAVLITDYYIVNTGLTSTSNIIITDTLNSHITATGNTVVSPSIAGGYRILFLKYK